MINGTQISTGPINHSQLSIAMALKQYFPGVELEPQSNGTYIAEFGGELPARFVRDLKDSGAEVTLYTTKKGQCDTVVEF